MKPRSLLLLLGLVLTGCQVQDNPPAPAEGSDSSPTATTESSETKPTAKKSIAFVTNKIADF